MLSAANRQGIVREFHIAWRVVTLMKVSEEIGSGTGVMLLSFQRRSTRVGQTMW